MVGGGGGGASSTAAGSGGQFTGLPTPGTFFGFGSFSFLLSASVSPSIFILHICFARRPQLGARVFYVKKLAANIPCDVLKGARPSLLFFIRLLISSFVSTVYMATGAFCTFSCSCPRFIKRPRPPLIHYPPFVSRGSLALREIRCGRQGHLISSLSGASHTHFIIIRLCFMNQAGSGAS